MSIENLTNMADLIIDASKFEDLDENAMEVISSHNAMVVTLSHGFTLTALTQVLINKGIMTAEEFAESFSSVLDPTRLAILTKNRDEILQYIESTKDYMDALKDMHANMTPPEASGQIEEFEIPDMFTEEDDIK